MNRGLHKGRVTPGEVTRAGALKFVCRGELGEIADEALVATSHGERLNVDAEGLEASAVQVGGLSQEAEVLFGGQVRGGYGGIGVEGHGAFEHRVGERGIVGEAGAEHGVHLGCDVGHALIGLELGRQGGEVGKRGCGKATCLQ